MSLENINDDGEFSLYCMEYEKVEKEAEDMYIKIAETIDEYIAYGDLNDLKELLEIVPKGMFRYRIREAINKIEKGGIKC